MRTQEVWAQRPRVRGAVLTLSLLTGGALLGGPTPAWAQGRVTFNQMSIESCKGTCTYKLSCGVASQPTELVSGKQGRAKDLIEIGKAIEVQRFPATVTCKAWKDTGWIGTTWTEIGSGTVNAAAGGDYKLDIDGAEGAVRVLMAIDSLELFIPTSTPMAPPPAAGKKAAPARAGAPLQVAAVFNPGKEGHAVVIGLEFPAFKDKIDKLGAQGLKLVDIETFEDGGKRLWSGIFKNVPDRVVLRANLEWDEFSKQFKQMTGGRARLVDMEIYGDSAKPQFAGLFRDLSETHSLWVGQDRKDFVAKAKEIREMQDQQLIDVEVYRGNGKMLYAGTWRHTSGKYDLWTNLDRAAFESQWKQAANRGLQMVDIETYRDGGKRTYDAIVRSGMGSPGEMLLESDLGGFVKRWLDATGRGMRLASVELYRD
jgi:hypothetical protein